MRKTALVKLSGDTIEDERVFRWLKGLSSEYYLVIITGGGTQITPALKREGIFYEFLDNVGRWIDGFRGRQMARDILENNQAQVQDALHERGIPATVVIPVLDIGSVLCHVNGDHYLRMGYLGFDKLFVVTLPERLEKKRQEFTDMPRIEVIAF